MSEKDNTLLDEVDEDIARDVLRRQGLIDLEEKAPADAREEYLDYKEREESKSTADTYRPRIQGFVDWCEENGIDTMNDIDSEILDDFYKYRRTERSLSESSLESYQKTLKRFIRYCGQKKRWTRRNLYQSVEVPDVSEQKRSRDDELQHSRAKKIVKHLGVYDAYRRPHLTLTLFADTGMRKCTLRSLDLDDYNSDESVLELRHRPDKGTRLKNGYDSERNIIISEYAAEVLEGYVERRRNSVTDEFGRQPLLATNQGRLCDSAIQKYVYRATQPCLLSNNCPSGRELSECEARRSNEKASQCPHSLSPHPIRRGYITQMKRNGHTPGEIRHRCDVSEGVVDAHYDARDKTERAKQQYYGSNTSSGMGMDYRNGNLLPPCADPDKDRSTQNSSGAGAEFGMSG